MADDAMDWKPTTPPTFLNPYLPSRRMPGEWPIPSLPHQYTSVVLERKRPSTFVERAAKRVCSSIWTIGSYAVLTIKPIYIVVRNWHDSQRAAGRRSRRDQARRRHSQSKQRPLPESAGRKSSAQLRLRSQPTYDPNSEQIRIGSVAFRNHFNSPSAASITDTETTIATPASRRSLFVQNTDHRGAAGRKRARETEEEITPSAKRLRYSRLGDYLNATALFQHSTPAPVMLPEAETVPNGSNPFDAGYKRSPVTYGGRGLVRGAPLKEIGAKVKGNKQNVGVWGIWEHEKPIQVGNPESAVSSSFEEAETKSEEQGPGTQQDGDDSELESMNTTIPLASAKSTTDLGPDDTQVLFDERWSTDGPNRIFHPEDYKDDNEDKNDQQASSIPQQNKPAVEGSSTSGMFKRWFLRNGTAATPPPIRTRSPAPKVIQPTKLFDHAQLVAMVEGSKANIALEHNDAVKSIDDQEAVNDSMVNPVAAQDGMDMGKIMNGLPEKVVNGNAPVPTTPLKVVAEKPAEQQQRTQEELVAGGKKIIPETPAEKLSRLKLKENEDDDTPKATPHSGTKTMRITRYREALEKAAKAKLEQYEIVPISSQWDDKVRKAVRNGIPDFLGPHDLARVVPQYAGQSQDNWLNDETINKYLELVAAHGRKNDRPDQVSSHYTFNNFFYNNLKTKGPGSVARWGKRAKIGGKNLAYVEKIFVPINSGAHWTLAVVEPTQKRITHYNSMRGSGTGMRACEDLQGWVAMEQGKDFKAEEWTLTAVGQSPQQTNSDDCGIFTITSARQIMLGYTPMSYSSAQIPVQRIRIVAELINKGLLRSGDVE